MALNAFNEFYNTSSPEEFMGLSAYTRMVMK